MAAKIVMMTDVGEWKTLDTFPVYDMADEAYDHYCDKYPHAFIDIIEYEDRDLVIA